MVGQESTTPTTAANRIDYVDVRTLTRQLWRKKWIILVVMALAFLSGLRDVRSFQAKSVAEMTIAPVDSGAASNTSSSGLPQILGLFGAGQQQTGLDRLKVVIGSTAFAGLMDEKYDLLKTIYAGSWDEQSQTWREPSGFRFRLESRIRDELRLPKWSEPSVSAMSDFLSSAIVFQPIGTTRFSEIQFAHQDAEFAKTLLHQVVTEADQLLRLRDVGSMARDREYILGKLETITQGDLRSVLFDMLRTTEGKTMLAERTGGYAIEIIQPVYVKERKAGPDLVSKLLLPTVVAFLLSVVLISIWALFRAESQD